MNHDYAHCIDYSPDCPAECFRARLTQDFLKNRAKMPNAIYSWMHLKGTDECLRGDGDADPKD